MRTILTVRPTSFEDGVRDPGGPGAYSSPRPGDTRGDGPAAPFHPGRPAGAAAAGDGPRQPCNGSAASWPPAHRPTDGREGGADSSPGYGADFPEPR